MTAGCPGPACPRGGLREPHDALHPLVAIAGHWDPALSACGAPGPRRGGVGGRCAGWKRGEAVRVGPVVEKERRSVKSQI